MVFTRSWIGFLAKPNPKIYPKCKTNDKYNFLPPPPPLARGGLSHTNDLIPFILYLIPYTFLYLFLLFLYLFIPFYTFLNIFLYLFNLQKFQNFEISFFIDPGLDFRIPGGSGDQK